jgi:hypothetical protein
MQNLDPTYLRYIYDNLIKGIVHPENASELPEGLIGLYEEAFEEHLPVMERQLLLKRFALFAILKKEVSTAFVTKVLEEKEEVVLEFINNYSSWFNSQEPGKFQLYHERLKVFVLQKLSENEIQTIHEKLIARLELAIEDQLADEFEKYALEFLSEHLYVEAMFTGYGQKLLDLAYSQSHWQRQLKICKGYTWTKNGLKEVMSWASKYNDDEVIECGLQMVDLHHQEQNAAPQIVALVAEGDFDAALKRIEQFGGNDKEGLQRKFILYMLCLMELTLLDSKDKSFRKVGIEKLLKHMEDIIPVDHSMLSWNEFFPSYLMFKVSCCLEEIGLDYFILFDRTFEWDTSWIELKGPYRDLEIDLLLKLNKRLADPENAKRFPNQSAIAELNRNVFYVLYQGDILITMYTQGKLLDSKKILDEVQNSLTVIPEWDVERRVFSLLELFTKFTHIFKTDDLIFLLNDAYSLSLSEDMNFSSKEQEIFEKLMRGYLKCGRLNEAYDISKSHLKDTIVGSDGLKLSNAIKEIALKHASAGNIEVVKQLLGELPIDTFENESFKCNVLAALSTECYINDRIEDAIDFMTNAKLILDNIYLDWNKNDACKSIAIELARQNKWDEAMELIIKIPKNEWFHSSALCAIALVKCSSMNYELSQQIINESILSVKEIDDSFHKTKVLTEIFDYYIINRDFKCAILLQKEIFDDYGTANELLIKVYREMSLYQDFSIVHSTILKNSFISEIYTKDNTKFLENTISEHAFQGEFEKANFIRRVLIDKYDKNRALYEIYKGVLIFIKTKDPNNSLLMLNQLIESTEKLSDESERDIAYRILIPEIANSGQMELAAKIANERNTYDKLSSFCLIAQKLHETGKIDEADKLLNQVLNMAQRYYLNDKYRLAILIKKISSVYISMNILNKAKELLNDMLKQIENSMLGYETILELFAFEYATMNDIEKAVEISKKIKNEVFPGEVYLNIYDILINNRNLNGIDILTEAAIDKSKEEWSTDSRIHRTLKIADKLYVFGAKSNADKIIQDCIEELRKMKEEYLHYTYLGLYGKSDDFIFGSDYLIDSLIRQNRLDQLNALASEFLELREDIWCVVGKSLYNNKDFNDTLNIIKDLKDPHIINSIIEGISIALSSDYKVREDIIVPFLKLNSKNITSKEHILQLYALHQLFFEELSEEKIQRLNRTLNLQWAIDLKKELDQLPN